MGTADNIELVRRFYAAGPPEDDTERRKFANAEITWHVPGENPVSGRYDGFEAVFSEIGTRMQPLSTWEIEVVDVMGNADLVVASVHLVAARGATRVETDGAHVFRFGPDGRIVEGLGFHRRSGWTRRCLSFGRLMVRLLVEKRSVMSTATNLLRSGP